MTDLLEVHASGQVLGRCHCEGRAVPTPLPVTPLLYLEGAIQRLGGPLRVHVLPHGAVHTQAVLGNCLALVAAVHFITVISNTK